MFSSEQDGGQEEQGQGCRFGDDLEIGSVAGGVFGHADEDVRRVAPFGQIGLDAESNPGV